MGIIVWIVLGLMVGIVARNLVSDGDPRRLIIATLIGTAGAFLGGFVATRLVMVKSTQGLFDLSTWVTAVMGAAFMLFFLLTYQLITRHRRPALHPLERPQATPSPPSPPRPHGHRESDV